MNCAYTVEVPGQPVKGPFYSLEMACFVAKALYNQLPPTEREQIQLQVHPFPEHLFHSSTGIRLFQ